LDATARRRHSVARRRPLPPAAGTVGDVLVRFSLNVHDELFAALDRVVTFDMDDVKVGLHRGPHPQTDEIDIVWVTATAEVSAPAAASEALNALAIGLVPTGTGPSTFCGQPEVGGPIPEHGLTFEQLPQSLRDLSQRINPQLSEAASAFFELLRWRYDLDGPPRATSSLGSRWSEDGSDWLHFPTAVSTSARFAHLGISFTAEQVSEIEHLIGTDTFQPLGAALLREADFLIHQSIATALVLGVTAIEIGVKELIRQVQPDTTWLLENSPSPPVVRILSDYLPKLPTVLDFGGAVLPPPASTLSVVRKAVTLRNRASHYSPTGVSLSTTEQVLNAADDLLRLFDYYAGNAWALDYMSDEFRRGLGLDDDPRDQRRRRVH